MIYHLLSNQECFEKVREELDNAMPDVKKLASWRELETLTYFNAVLKETLRVNTVVTNRISLTEPKEDLVYQTWVIPKGTPISMSAKSMHDDPNIFPEPAKFNPSRWLKSEEGESKDLERYLAPFSRGPRSCLGVNLAYAEIYLTIAAVLRRFEFALHDTVRERDVDVVRDCFVGMATKESKGIRVQVLGERS